MSTLFTAVSVEQQETVAGGVVVVPVIDATKDLEFTQNNAVLLNASEVNANSAKSTNIFYFANTNSRATEGINLNYRIV